MILIFLIFGFCAFYWGSSISLLPVPGADEGRVILLGTQWLSGQSDLQFFKEPLLPLLMALLSKIGFSGVHGLRLLGWVGFFAFIYRLIGWMRFHRVFQNAPLWIWTVGLAVLFSPVLTLSISKITPWVWIGFLWLSILIELERPGLTSHWKVARYFVTLVFFRMEFFVLIPIIWIALFPFDQLNQIQEPSTRVDLVRRFLGRLWSFNWKAGVFLSPIVLSFGAHLIIPLLLNLPKEELSTVGLVAESADRFSGLFQFWALKPREAIELIDSSLKGTGKGLDLLDLKKSIFYFPTQLGTFFLFVASCLGLLMTIQRGASRCFRDSVSTVSGVPGADGKNLSLRLTSALGLLAVWLIFRWSPNPNFAALFHFFAWPVVVLFISDWVTVSAWIGTVAVRILQPLFMLTLVIILICGFALTLQRWSLTDKIPKGLVWESYRAWVDCIEVESGRNVKLTQIGDLDFSVEFWGRSPDQKIVFGKFEDSTLGQFPLGHGVEQRQKWIWTQLYYDPIQKGSVQGFSKMESVLDRLKRNGFRVCHSGLFLGVISGAQEDGPKRFQ